MAKSKQNAGGKYFKGWESPLNADRPGKDPGPANEGMGTKMPGTPANPMGFKIPGAGRGKK